MKPTLPEPFDISEFDQIGFVVRDLHRSLALYEPLFGPFAIMEPGPMTYTYRGVSEECTLRLAFGRSAGLEIELIEWVSGGCPHREFLDAGREGLHHLRFRVPDLESRVAAARPYGYESVWDKRFGAGLAVAYLERAGDPLMVELFENP